MAPTWGDFWGCFNYDLHLYCKSSKMLSILCDFFISVLQQIKMTISVEIVLEGSKLYFPILKAVGVIPCSSSLTVIFFPLWLGGGGEVACFHHVVSILTKPLQPGDQCMEISAKKIKLMINNSSGFNTEIKVNEQKLETITMRNNWIGTQVSGLRYSWWGFQAWDTLQDSTYKSIIDKVGTSLEWQEYFSQFHDTSDALPCHIHHSVCLWIMDHHSKLQRRIQAMEMRCYRKILRISYKDRVTNEEVCAKIQQAIRPHEDLLTIVKRYKLQWYGHVSCSLGLAKTILQRTVKGENTRQTEKEVGRQHQGMDRLGVCQVPEGSGEKKKREKTGCEVIWGAQETLTVKG